MTYVPPFSIIKQKVNISGSDERRKVIASYEDFIAILKMMLRGVSVDEQWYLSQYPDVAAAIKTGVYKSAKNHFIEEGYFEGRHPAKPTVDENWYLKNNEDIAASIKSGVISSALEHFIEHGYAEGRLPSEY